MKRNTKIDETSDSDVIVEKTVLRHKIYKGNNVELQILSESLKQFKVEDWEDSISWYKETPE